MPLNRLIFLFLCTVCFAAKATGQCNARSIIFPATDTVIALNSTIHLTSLSQNATSVSWVNQYSTIGSGNTVDFTARQAGINTVYLIAQNGDCSATSSINIIVRGNVQPGLNYKAFYGEEGWLATPTCIAATKDSGYLVLSEQYRSSNGNAEIQLYLFKVNQHGCILWSTKYSIYAEEGTQTVKPYTVIETSDGGALLSGFSTGLNFFVKLNNTGKIIWHKQLTRDIGDITNNRILKEVADGYLICGAGGTYDENGGFSNSGVAITKIDKKGKIAWSKIYSSTSTQDATGLEVINGYAYMSGYVVLAQNIYAAFLSKIDAATGDAVWTKRYQASGNETFSHSDTLADKLLLTRSGDAGIGYMLINQDGSIASNNTISYTQLPGTSNLLVKFMSCHNNEIAMFLQTGTTLPLQPYYVIWSKLAKFVPGQSQASWGYQYRAQIPDATVGYDTSIAATVQGFGVIEHTEIGGGYVRIDKFGFSGQHSTCDWGGTDLTSSPASNYSVTDLPWQTTRKLNLITGEMTFNYIRPSSAYMFDCPAYFKGCTQIVMHGKDSICNMLKTYTYSVTKGAGCTNPATFFADASAVKAVAATDTSITVKFIKEGSFIIRAQLEGECSTLKDSILVNIKGGTISNFSLGEDVSICKGDSAELHAGGGFVSYAWQNGAQDSVMYAVDSGKYYVTVTDKCDYTYSDTVQVSYRTSIPVSLGPDIQKCNSDTLLITAPAGFANYSWGPAYNMLQQGDTSIKVFPSKDTSYTVKVGNKQGCTGFDTVHVTVLTSPGLQLAKDTSFCKSDTIVLIPTSGFTSYSWSNNILSYTDTINTAGTYYLKALYSNGCYSADTVTVKVFERPVLQLPASAGICEHSSYLLNPGGNYASYLWQDGSKKTTFNAVAPGTYWVKAINNNGCTSTDTTIITGYLQQPSGFLQAADSVCVYKPISVKASGSWATYEWSTGDVTPSITVSSPGIYWLRVSGANNCYAKDTIQIAEKNCIYGIFFPSAFSPNGDNNNDLLKPIVHIAVSDYYFVIYNRFGKKIFETKEKSNGLGA